MLRSYSCVGLLVLLRAGTCVLLRAELETVQAVKNELTWHHGHLGTVPMLLRLDSSCELPRGLTDRMRPAPKNGKKWMDSMVEYFQSDKPFTMIRLGDADWMCALGYGMQTGSDGETLRGDVCSHLFDSILQYGASDAPDDANFFPVVGTFFICKEEHPETFEMVDLFLRSHRLQSRFDGFVDDFYFPLFPNEEQAKKSGLVIPRLVNKDVVVVGPQHLRKLRTTLGFTDFVEVPVDAWNDKDRILKRIDQASAMRADVNVKFLVAAGQSGRVLMHEAWKKHGRKDTFVDVGASLDGYAGVESREYNSHSHICGNAALSKYVAPGVCE